MSAAPPQTPRTIDLTGLPEEAVRAVEALVKHFRQQYPRLGGTTQFASREEWIAAITAWAKSHPPLENRVDISRESFYEGRGE